MNAAPIDTEPQQYKQDRVRRGRPPGTEETPERLLRAELLAQLKLYRKIREMVEARVTTAPVGEMDAEEVGKYMDLLRKGIVDIARTIAPATAGQARAAVEVENPEELLERMLSGPHAPK